LHIIEAFGVSLPDVDFGASDWIAFDVSDSANHEKWLPTRISRDRTSILAVDSLMGMKRAKDRAICATFWLRVIDRINQQGKTQDVREEDEFLNSDP
jgi:hypothetical protein